MTRIFRRPVLRVAAFIAAVALGGATAAQAACTGKNLFGTLPAADRQALDAATAAQPFAQGNLWRATKDGATLHLLGTYHLPDPRHAATLERIEPILQAAQTLLVEAGPEEERALKADLARDPGLLFLQDGPSLMERMPPEDWQTLSAAMTRRNIPAVMAAKMRPWYLAVSLAMPPCSLPGATTGSGLDQTLASRAKAKGIAIRALEPHTTVFRIFEQISEADQIAMIRTTLLMEDRVDDYAVTMADSYFAEDSRRLWELLRHESAAMPGYTPEKADAEYARVEAAMMTGRNRAWIAVIEDAAARGPTLAAFGALHLSGHGGVLQLLAERGWTIERLPV